MRIEQSGYIYDVDSKQVKAEVFEGDNAAIPADKEFFFGSRQQAESEGLDFTEFNEHAR